MSANDLPAGGPEPGAAPVLGNHAAPPFDVWQGAQAWTQTWVAGLDPQGQGRWQREVRLARLVETALQDSPWYRRSARGARRLADFPPVSKPELMAAFDDWSTDRRITRRGAEAFIRDGSRIADAWLGRYLVWTSSGTSASTGPIAAKRRCWPGPNIWSRSTR